MRRCPTVGGVGTPKKAFISGSPPWTSGEIKWDKQSVKTAANISTLLPKNLCLDGVTEFAQYGMERTRAAVDEIEQGVARDANDASIYLSASFIMHSKPSQ